MVNVDVSIDYPEYDVEDVTNSQISEMLDSVQTKLEILEKSFDNGKLIKEFLVSALVKMEVISLWEMCIVIITLTHLYISQLQ